MRKCVIREIKKSGNVQDLIPYLFDKIDTNELQISFKQA